MTVFLKSLLVAGVFINNIANASFLESVIINENNIYTDMNQFDDFTTEDPLTGALYFEYGAFASDETTGVTTYSELDVLFKRGNQVPGRLFVKLGWSQFDDSLPETLCKTLGKEFVDYTRKFSDRTIHNFISIAIPRSRIEDHRGYLDSLRVKFMNDLFGKTYSYTPMLDVWNKDQGDYIIQSIQCK